jgi:hypothetical protein
MPKQPHAPHPAYTTSLKIPCPPPETISLHRGQQAAPGHRQQVAGGGGGGRGEDEQALGSLGDLGLASAHLAPHSPLTAHTEPMGAVASWQLTAGAVLQGQPAQPAAKR